MKWFEKLHPSERTDRVLQEVLKRTGIGEKIGAEMEAERAVKHAELRKRKSAAIAKFIKARDAAETAARAAEAKERAARADADAALRDFIKTREALSGAHDAVQSEVAPLDAELTACADPAIDEFLVELDQLRAGCPSLLATWPEKDGPLRFADGRKARDNQAAVERRLREIARVTDVARTLKTRHDIDDVLGEIARLRASIPEVTRG